MIGFFLAALMGALNTSLWMLAMGSTGWRPWGCASLSLTLFWVAVEAVREMDR